MPNVTPWPSSTSASAELDGEPALVESIGLFGTDPEAELADARRVRIRGPRAAGRAAARAAAARDGADDAGRVRVLAVGGAILLLDALFLGLLGRRQRRRRPGRIPPVNRSISAVLLGTFTLRFSTGLTGGLLVYYLDALPEYGGVRSPAPPSAS